VGNATRTLVVSVSDQRELRSLRDWFRSVRDVSVTQEAGETQDGELGALDYVTVIAGSGGLIAAIRILPEFIRARRPELKITMTVQDKKFTIDAKNVDDVMPIVEKLIDN
jgi:hypothetical protein